VSGLISLGCYSLPQITRIVKQLNEQMIAKGTEINDFRNKHNIKIARPGQSA
jgi:hypothetical protein